MEVPASSTNTNMNTNTNTNTNMNMSLSIDGVTVPIEKEKSLLEVIRKAHIDIPTFCYHSELSVYGACRLCMVEVENRGLVAACSVIPEPGLKVRTNTQEIRDIRRMSVELVLASHDQQCPTCDKSDACKLRSLAAQLGIDKVRFRQKKMDRPLDQSSYAIVRDPNKCVLCGDCVRYCHEIQGVGAIDFSHRGSQVRVGPAFGRDLASGECVDCGQCAAVCPTGALSPRSEIDQVYKALSDPQKTVVAQVAPAVRVAIGEIFHLPAGVVSTGQIVAALRRLGFHKVFDTCFAADLTVMEEATELIGRKAEGNKLPLFTSCCPGWVKYAEQYFPSLLSHLSSCKSPQQMFGSLAKPELAQEHKKAMKDVVVVAIMPCTAKKFEAKRPEFTHDGVPEVDHVLTTQEFGRMIKQAGIQFHQLPPESMDLPFGISTGAGVIFGNSGGVTEAVVRFAAEKLAGAPLEQVDFLQVRGQDGLREASVTIGETTLRLAIVSGLKNAKRLAEDVLAKKVDYDVIEVMACPGGCIGGAGQPVTHDAMAKSKRTQGLFNADKNMQFHKSQDNPHLKALYAGFLRDRHTAHELLHTHYSHRRRIDIDHLDLIKPKEMPKIKVCVCVGTSCFLKGSQTMLSDLGNYLVKNHLTEQVQLSVTFCSEKCDKGPSVTVGDKKLYAPEWQSVIAELEQSLERARKEGAV